MFLGAIKLPFHRKCSLSTLRHINPTQCHVFLSITSSLLFWNNMGFLHFFFMWLSPPLLLVVSVILRHGSPLRKPFYFLGGMLRGAPLWASMPKYIALSRRAFFMTWKTTCNKSHLLSLIDANRQWSKSKETKSYTQLHSNVNRP